MAMVNIQGVPVHYRGDHNLMLTLLHYINVWSLRLQKWGIDLMRPRQFIILKRIRASLDRYRQLLKNKIYEK